MDKKNQNFYERLNKLPEVFSLNTAVKVFQMDKQIVKNYLSDWKTKGFIESFGPRTSLYFNIYKNPRAKFDNWHNALREIYPEGIFAGVNILREASWMTQISRRSEIIVYNQLGYKQIFDVELMPRSKTWFKRYHEGIVWIEDEKRKLKPEYALVDLCEQKGYIPDPDDLFLEDEDIVKIKETFAKLKVDIPEKLHDILEFTPSVPGLRKQKMK